MPHRATTVDFPANAAKAMADTNLQKALEKMRSGFIEKRLAATGRLPEFNDLRDEARDIKDHVLANLDHYLERFEAQVVAQGGHVHWCRDATEARAVILDLCQDAEARSVTKSKSMIAEEIDLNPVLVHPKGQGVTVIDALIIQRHRGNRLV